LQRRDLQFDALSCHSIPQLIHGKRKIEIVNGRRDRRVAVAERRTHERLVPVEGIATREIVCRQFRCQLDADLAQFSNINIRFRLCGFTIGMLLLISSRSCQTVPEK
jgi:hypothetical protein